MTSPASRPDRPARTSSPPRVSTTGSVTLNATGAQQWQSGRPWVYRSDVTSAPELPGVYPVEDPHGRPLGFALVNARSEITVRVLSRAGALISAENLQARAAAAVAFRLSLNPDGDAYRLVHGDADGLPGLVIDRYNDYLVVQCNSAALEPYLNGLLVTVSRLVRPRGILGRFDSPARAREGLDSGVRVLAGKVPDLIEAREGAVRFLVDARKGQKTGAYLDQRENRLALGRVAARVAALAPGRQALDVFAYQASFGLHLALAGLNTESVDSSADALARGKENAALNGLDERMSFTVGNAFEVLRAREREGRRYAAINLDPPAFAKARRDLDAAYRAYKEVNLRAMKLLEPGGVLGTSSCSFHVSPDAFATMLREAAADAGRSLRVLEWRGQAADHPELLNAPESHYLKFALLEALP